MKYWVICLQCNFKEKRELIPAEEALRQKIQISPPRCQKCGSHNIKTEKA